MTAKASDFVQQIRDQYPDIRVRTARLDTSGQNSDILIVNMDVIFRFPRYPDGIARLRTEVAILSALQPYVALPVPEPIYHHLNTNTPGAAFIGYPMLPGEPFWRDTLDERDQPSRNAIATQLATFLRSMHQAPVAANPDLPIVDGRAFWRDMYERIRTNLFTHMRPDARIAVTDHFETFLDEPGNFTWSPVLRHGDFGPSNILFDPASRRITGIIDFGSAGLGDPAIDITALSGYGPAFLDAFHTVYPVTAAMMARIAFYRGTFALQEALFGIEHNDSAAFASGIIGYQ